MMPPAFETLDAQKTNLLAYLNQLPPELLSFRPAPTSWSALQVLEHLIKVEVAYIGAVRETLPNPQRVSLKDRFGALAVQIAMRLPTRIKTPGSVAAAIIPEASGDLQSITADWQTVRSEMHRLLKTLSPSQTRAGLFRHPVAGWMTAAQGISFLTAHLVHHRFQLRRLESAYGSKIQTSRKLR